MGITNVQGGAGRFGMVVAGDQGTEPAPADGSFDPAAHKVDEVLVYAAGHPDEVGTIVEMERAGKSRVTLLEQLTGV